MKTKLFNDLISYSLLVVNPSEYERRKAKGIGFAYPEYFNVTKSIYIHIPKTAGTSLGMALYGRQIPHLTWREWNELNPRKFKKYFKFSIIRDPLDRFASAFDFLKAGGINEADKAFGDAYLRPFENANEFARALIDYDLQQKVMGWFHFRPQASFIADELGQSKVDFLIRFENLNSGYSIVTNRIGSGMAKLPYLNKTEGRGKMHFDREANAVIECLYQQDIHLWSKHAS